MFFSFRSKLFLLSVVLIAGFLLVSGAYLHFALKSWIEAQIEGDLLLRTEMLAEAMLRMEDPEEMEFLFESLGKHSPQRVSLFQEDGVLLYDTFVAREEIPLHPRKTVRPELAAALGNEIGRSRRVSTTLGEEVLYAATRVGPEGPILRVAVPLKEAEPALAHLRLLLLIGGFFGLGVAIFMSSFASSLMSKNLQEVLARSRNSQTPQPSGSLKQITRELSDTLATLATERDRFRAVLDGMTEGVIATDQAGGILMKNDAATDLFRQQNGLEEFSINDLLPHESLQELLKKARAEGGSTGEFDLRASLTATPRRVHARITTRPNTAGFIFVLHDITALRRLETIRRDFVANVSHELRTPVAIIQANAETLLDGALQSPEHARIFTEAIHRNSERLGRLVSDLLDISRIEAGQRDFDLRSLSVRAAVLRALEVARQGAKDLNERIRVTIDDDLKVRADSGALDQILVNLIDNAMKYGSPEDPIDVEAFALESLVEIRVRDRGTGLSAEHHNRVFERFYRVDEGRSTQMGGTGLGLSIVKHLVTSMNGEVGYRLHPENGSIFWFRLPGTHSR